MRFPDFLIIGGMKCGTTTLYFDLRTNPAIFLPEDKEPTSLATDRVLETAGKKAYSRLFRAAHSNQVCGEASTGYSKLPDIPGVPTRARKLTGEGLKIFYLVREPVARVVSHHYHEVTAGTMESDIDRAVRSNPCLINYSKYALQLRPWLETFGSDNVFVIRFQDYITDRRRQVAKTCRELGVQPLPQNIDIAKVYNKSEEARVPSGVIWRFSRGRLYRSVIRPWISRPFRTWIRKAVTAPAPPRPRAPKPSTVDYILDAIGSDIEELRESLDMDSPFWDLEDIRHRHAQRAS